MSIISTQRLRKCQGFIDKVSEIRFNKIKQRQLNKFQNLVNRKEGNITRVCNSPQAGNNLVASRQAGTLLPSGEGSNTPPASPFLSPGEGDGPRAFQAGLGAHLLSGEGSNSSPQATVPFLPGKVAILPQQLLTFPPVKEAVLPKPLLTFPGKEVVLPRQLLTFLLGKATVALPSQVKQAIKLGQVGRASGILPGIGHPRLPRRIALSPRQTTLTPGKGPPLPPSPIGFPKGLLMKNLALSESLTYPANL